MDLKIIYTTMPDEDSARGLAKTLVEEKLAACVNILPNVESTYIFNGQACQESEYILLIKTSVNNVDRAFTRVEKLHPYEVPAILVFSPDKVSDSYLNWVIEK